MKVFPGSVSRLKGQHILVTGGAGFIGSNLVEALLKIGARVTVLDDLSTGFEKNIERFASSADFSFIQGDIRDAAACRSALAGTDAVSHQAALGSVPRSIEFPLTTHDVNATGFLTMLDAAKEAGIRRFVFASSSSVYGDSRSSPKKEGNEGNALSPYAVSKQLNEQYAGVYHRLHGMETIGLRYFNVFGPYQNPNGVYAAAIPKFLEKMRLGGEIVVNGDGNQTRDFTFVQNAVLANLLSLSETNTAAFGKVFNVACGRSLTLNNVLTSLENGLIDQGTAPAHTLIYGPKRVGDVQDSLADISTIREQLGYEPAYSFEEGIAVYLDFRNT
jgi:nucleoside-diphosphate-sugar epimerase